MPNAEGRVNSVNGAGRDTRRDSGTHCRRIGRGQWGRICRPQCIAVLRVVPIEGGNGQRIWQDEEVTAQGDGRDTYQK